MLGSLPSLLLENCSGGLSVLLCAGLGQFGQSVTTPHTRYCSPLLSLVQKRASASPLGLGFSVVSFPCIVASCSSCEGAEVENDLCHHLSVTEVDTWC